MVGSNGGFCLVVSDLAVSTATMLNERLTTRGKFTVVDISYIE
jgi:hypothetical protein